MINGEIYDKLSLKFKANGAGELPLFRMKMENEIPYLGNFGYAPIYFYVKKCKDGFVTEILTLPTPTSTD
jgi:hypothetical protein